MRKSRQQLLLLMALLLLTSVKENCAGLGIAKACNSPNESFVERPPKASNSKKTQRPSVERASVPVVPWFAGHKLMSNVHKHILDSSSTCITIYGVGESKQILRVSCTNV